MRDVLQREFDKSRLRNKRYSLRAFAVRLGTDHSTLSKILRGTRKPSASQCRAWAQRLGMDREEAGAYVIASNLPSDDSSSRQWAAEAMCVIQDGEHWEIVRLCGMPEFQPDCRWIAAKIDTSADRVNLALSRLLRLGLIDITSAAGWRNVANLRTEQDFKKLALERVRKHTCPVP